MCVCVCVYIYVYIYILTYLHTYANLRVYVYVTERIDANMMVYQTSASWKPKLTHSLSLSLSLSRIHRKQPAPNFAHQTDLLDSIHAVPAARHALCAPQQLLRGDFLIQTQCSSSIGQMDLTHGSHGCLACACLHSCRLILHGCQGRAFYLRFRLDVVCESLFVLLLFLLSATVQAHDDRFYPSSFRWRVCSDICRRDCPFPCECGLAFAEIPL